MGAKIFVFSLKKLIKTAAVAVIALGAAAAVIHMAGKNKSLYNPGTYSTDIILHSNPVSVDLTVTRSEIIGVELNNMTDTAEVFYPTISSCIDEIAQAVIDSQSTDIELNSDYEVAGEIILAAIDADLEKAKK